MSTAVIPESIAQLQLQLDEIRSTRPRGKRLPDSVWQEAVELAREHGVYSVARHLRLDYMRLKKRLGGVSHRRRKARKPTFVELIEPPSAMQPLYVMLVNRAYDLKAPHAVRKSSTNQGTGRVVEEVEEHFRLLPPKSPEFDHFTPAAFLIENGSLFKGSPELALALDRFEKLLIDFNTMLPAQK